MFKTIAEDGPTLPWVLGYKVFISSCGSLLSLLSISLSVDMLAY